MADALKNIVAGKLGPGYDLEMHNGKWYVRDTQGQFVRDPNTQQYVTIRNGDTHWATKENTLATLRRAGAIPPPPPRKPKPRAAAITRSQEKSNPILLAKGILRDPKATPRERGIAGSYLNLVKAHEEVMTLARKLGQALKEATGKE